MRALSARLCCEQGFDEMKRACAYCGMLEDEDDILVCCQVPECSLRADVAQLLWATREHGGRIVHGAPQQHVV